MKRYVAAVVCLALLLFAGGCGQKNEVEPQSLLGASDEELVSARGEGDVTEYDFQDEKAVSQRKYEETLFGLDAQVEYLYSDDEHVAQIVATFHGVEKEELVNAVSYHLGKPPFILQNESEELDFMAKWEKDGVAYISRRIPNSSLYILMEKTEE